MKIYTEMQVRTVFEEAWSEIDHIIRYPYDVNNPILNEYLSIFNRIVGSADEMGTFIKNLKIQLSVKTLDLNQTGNLITNSNNKDTLMKILISEENFIHNINFFEKKNMTEIFYLLSKQMVMDTI